MEVAVENDKTQRKEGEDEGVFLGFGDDLAVDPNLHRAAGICRKPGASTVTECSRKEVANRFVDQAGARPSRRLPAGIAQTAGSTNSHVI